MEKFKETPSRSVVVEHSYGKVNDLDVHDINALLNGSVRNHNLCITKDQLKHVCAQLLARNHMLEKKLKELGAK